MSFIFNSFAPSVSVPWWLFCWDKILICSPGWSWTHCISPVFLPQIPECWDYRHGSPHPALLVILDCDFYSITSSALLDIFWSPFKLVFTVNVFISYLTAILALFQWSVAAQTWLLCSLATTLPACEHFLTFWHKVVSTMLFSLFTFRCILWIHWCYLCYFHLNGTVPS